MGLLNIRDKIPTSPHFLTWSELTRQFWCVNLAMAMAQLNSTYLYRLLSGQKTHGWMFYFFVCFFKKRNILRYYYYYTYRKKGPEQPAKTYFEILREENV